MRGRIGLLLTVIMLMIALCGCAVGDKPVNQSSSQNTESTQSGLTLLSEMDPWEDEAQADASGETGRDDESPEEANAQNDSKTPDSGSVQNESASEQDGWSQSESGSQNQQAQIDEHGSYTSRDDVALYIHTYGKLPENFITKKEAEKLGWTGGSLEPYAPGKCIGGGRFGNIEGHLPDGNYKECDIDTLGKSKRGAKRIVYSDDGRIYYTDDHYASFTQLY